MFKNKGPDNCNNLCGKNIARLRKKVRLSQNKLAACLQLNGLDIDKNCIQRVECGKRFVTDIELVKFAEFFEVSFEELLRQ